MTTSSVNRRTFLETTAAVAASTLITRTLGWAAAEHKVENIGLQLYTVRERIKTDYDGTLAKVAEIGYKNVELAEFSLDDRGVRYFGRTPQEVRKTLDHYGLDAIGTHVSYSSLAPENFPKVLEASHVLGHQYIVNPWVEEEIRNQPDGWSRVIETFNRTGEACQKAGFQFGYHNHWFEFLPVNGKRPYDILLEGCDPKLVKMEMDLCWITAGGGDPVEYFERYPGRFPLVHVKDLKKIPPITRGGAQNFGDTVDLTEVGIGIIDWKRIFAHSQQAGIKYYIVEHDHPEDPVQSAAISYKYLKNLRW